MEKTCPDQHLLALYSSGACSETDAVFLSAHVERCSACSETIQRLENATDPFVFLLRNAASTPDDQYLEEAPLLQALSEVAALSLARPQHAGYSMDAVVTDLVKIGDQLREYQVLEVLGRGGMGVVYKARHRKLDRFVALKALPTSIMNAPTMLERFENEMRAIGSLDHPNIVRALDADEVDGIHLLVMEYVEGENLSSMIKRRGPVPLDEACDMIRQVTAGLQHIHEVGMVHRDMKPGNLMKASDGTVRILDLGLALLSSGKVRASGEGITETGQVIGTLDYMAPEQADDTRSVDIRADIYSLGATFYALLTGQAPFAGRGDGSVLQKLKLLATERPTPITELRPEISPEVVAVVSRMMERDPAMRFATPQELAVALHDLPSTRDGRHTHKTGSSNDRTSRPWRWIISSVLVAATLLLMSFLPSLIGTSEVLTPETTSDAAITSEAATMAAFDSADLSSQQDVAESSMAHGRTVGESLGKERKENAGDNTAQALSLRSAAHLLLQSAVSGNVSFSEVLDRLNGAADPTMRTALIHEFFASGLSLQTVLDALAQPQDAAVRAALWQALDQYSLDDLSEEHRDSLSDLILTAYQDDADPCVHAVIRGLVQHRPQTATDASAGDFWAELFQRMTAIRKQLQTRPISVDNGWFETLHDETMIVVPAGASFVAGSPPDEPGRVPDDSPHSEIQHTVSLPVSIAVSATEVTQQQYFDALRTIVPQPKNMQPMHPISGLSWHQAAWYCNRRSELEGFPEEQHCYQRISATPQPFGKFTLKENYQQLLGYRLLDEVEWEYCCRAGTTTARPFGDDESLAGEYIVMVESGHAAPLAVASRKPNALGFFDMLGNVAEWVNDPGQRTPRQTRRVRGGSTTTGYERLRSAIRLRIDEDHPHPTTGMRIARTLPDRSLLPPSPLVTAEVHSTWVPNATTSDPIDLSNDWSTVYSTEPICLGEGTRASTPRRWFRLRNLSDEVVTIGDVKLSGNVEINVKPDQTLAPGSATHFMISRSGVDFGLNFGECTINVKGAERQDSIRIWTTSALHGPLQHVFEGGMSGVPSSARNFSYGKVRQHSNVTHRFSIFNCGDRPLEIRDIQVPGGFHLRRDWNSMVNGGDFAWFTIKVDTEVLGNLSGQIIVCTNDSQQPEFGFAVSADVVEALPASIPGVFRDGMWLFDENRDGTEYPVFQFGQKGDVPLTGDWDGDGICDLCVCRPGDGPNSGRWTWHIQSLAEAGLAPVENALVFGSVEGTPLLIADGHSNRYTPVVVTPNEEGNLIWHFDVNRDGMLDQDRTVPFGSSLDLPVAADLDGTGVARIGYVRRWQTLLKNSEWHFRSSAADGDIVFEFSVLIDTPVVGDWNGDGMDEVGAFRCHPGHPVEWFLNLNQDALSEQEHAFGKLMDIPVVLSPTRPIEGAD